jgi:hypothetical protein
MSSLLINKESDKAVNTTIQIYLEIAPKGGYTSSLVRDKTFNREVWIPKSQITDGLPSSWVVNQKLNESIEWAELHYNCQVISSEVMVALAGGGFYNVTETVKAEVAANAEASLNAYFDFVQAVKQAGVKDIRERMCKSTIIERAQQQGIDISHLLAKK